MSTTSTNTSLLRKGDHQEHNIDSINSSSRRNIKVDDEEEVGHLRKPPPSSSSFSSSSKKRYPLVTNGNCNSYPQTIPNQQTFETLLKAYKRSIPKGKRFHRQRRDAKIQKMVAPVEIRFAAADSGKKKNKKRGRGIFATSTIKKDDLIYGDDYSATIYNEQQLVKYLTQLPPNLQCDALLWTYTIGHDKGGGVVVKTTFDENSLVNHGGGPAGTKGGRNINYLPRGSYSALVDIMEGEEILDDYSLYMKVNSVEWFDRIRENAWGNGDGGESEEEEDEEEEDVDDDEEEEQLEKENGQVQRQQDKSSNISLYLRQGSNVKVQVLPTEEDFEFRQQQNGMGNNVYNSPSEGIMMIPLYHSLFDDIHFIIFLFLLLLCFFVRRIITVKGTRPEKNQ